MRRNLAKFEQHYRQPLTEISVQVYLDGLRDLTAGELEAACQEAIKTSEFMPVVATIRNCLDTLRARRGEPNLGVPMISYPEISDEERADALRFSDALKKTLGLDKPTPVPIAPKTLRVVQSTLSLEEQKAELVRRGYLSTKPHDPRCLCQDCQKRRGKL